MYRKTLSRFLGVALLIVGVMTLGVAQMETKRVKTPRERLAERSFPNVTLTTHQGKKVKFYDDLLKDKIVLINFMYVKCEGSCPGTTANLARVQQLLGDRVGKDIFMYSITLKADEDTPADLAAYVDAYGVGPGWTFLTGPASNTELLRRRLGFADVDPARDRDVTQHSGIVVFGNEPYDSWSACPVLQNPTEIVKAISWVQRG